MLKFKIIFIVLALAAVLYLKFYVNLNEIVAFMSVSPNTEASTSTNGLM